MSYATLADLIARAGEREIQDVADRNGDGEPDAEVVAAALKTADVTIDGYLAVRYRVPLTTVPSIVIKWAVAIARYHLHRDGAPVHVAEDQKLALTELRDASAGRIGLPDVAGLQPDAAPGGALAEASPPVFTAANLEGWL